MARKVIDIGVAGNDGTGDSIRESFRKVNDNFRELYSSLGLGERLQLIGLDDTPVTYTGFENSVLSVNNTEDGVVFKQLDSGIGVNIDYTTDPTKIILNADFAAVSGDTEPQLGGNLSARSGGQQYRIQDLVTPITNDEATNKGYADTKVSLGGVDAVNPETGATDAAFGTMTGPLILSRDPIAEDDQLYNGLIAATKNYVDSSAFGSSVNLYVSTAGQDERPNLDPELQGRALAYAYRTIEAACKRAEEIMLESLDEIGPYKKVLTYNDGANQVTLDSIITSPDSGTGFAGTVFMSVNDVDISENFPGVNFRAGDIVTLTGGTFIEPAQFEVTATATTPGRIISIRILSSGLYTALPGSVEVETTNNSDIAQNLKLNVTYRVNNVTIQNGGSGYGLVSVRIAPAVGDTSGTGAFGRATIVGSVITSVTITNGGSGFTEIPVLNVDLPRFLLKTEGNRTDFSGNYDTDTPAAIRSRDVREGLFIRGETSGALAQILAHEGALDSEGNEIFDVDIKFGTFLPDEVISYGDVALQKQISILIESGIYEENFPIKVPTNVALIGNEFRRVLVRPRPGQSSSPWAFQKFKRDLTVDGINVVTQQFGYHYLTDSTQPVYPPINNKGDYLSAAELLRLNKSFIQKEVIAWINYQIANDIAPYELGFEYNQTRCERDVGLILDAMIFDLKYGGNARTVSAALKYYDSASGRIAITDQLSETAAAIERINVLAQLILRNTQITELYGTGSFPQVVDLAFTTEEGVGGSEVTISDISTTTPLFITTSSAHGFTDLQNIVIDGIIGTTELNGNDYFVIVRSPTEIYLYDNEETAAADLTVVTPGQNAIDGSEFAEYVSGGEITNNGGILGDLFNIILDIISGSGTFNAPKNNEEMDVFLMNDATILRAITGQGQGGFMMVLDPTGQILAKSPYCQESASFSRSTGFKTFAGGMFVDGFTGNLQFFLDTQLDTNRFAVSNLDRLPRLPASFIVDDTIFRINYVRNFVFSPNGSTAEFVLDEGTPYTGPLNSQNVTIATGSPGTFTTATPHLLQLGAVLRFNSTGSLPTGLQPNVDYFVIANGFTSTQFRVSATPGGDAINLTGTQSGTQTYRRVFEVLMPGNRSMLSNDYTQVNDLGYGLIATNGGLTEAVSMFTYYNEISYYSLNGGQIRSLGGSSAHGNYALVAEGSDPLEVPTPVTLYHNLEQGGSVFAETLATENKIEGTILFVTYDDYLPLPGSEIEVNHNGVITNYSISTVQSENVTTKLCRMNISTAGGLVAAIPNGQRITIRQNSYVVLTGDVVEVATRPSTALVLNDSNFVYRVLDFSLYDDAYDKDNLIATISAADPAVITTTVPHRQQAGYQIEFSTTGSLPAPLEINVVYYVLADGLTDTTFKIATTPAGTPIDTSGATQSGVHTIEPYNLALTQLRSNYDYVELNVVDLQPFVDDTNLTSVTVSTGTPGTINSTGHGLRIGEQLRFTAEVDPTGLPSGNYFWIASDSYGSNSFRLLDSTPVRSTNIGVGGLLTTNTITGLTDTSNISVGDKLIPKANRTGVSANGDGTTVTYTFNSTEIVPPYLPGQEIVVSGFVDYNGTFDVVTCTTTAVTVADTTNVGAQTGGIISVSATGSLGTNPTVASIPNSTSLIITAAGPSDGTVVFDIESDSIDIASTGTNVKYGKVIGDQGQTTIAISDISSSDFNRINNGITSGTPYKFAFGGEIYEIVAFEPSDSTAFAEMIVSPAIDISLINFNDPITLKAGLAVPSTFSRGTLTIRISLTRATSHDFLEIGTGSYADTNYPSEIFGPAVNSISDVPLFATNEDDDGNIVSRAQVQERGSGRSFFVSTDQFGNFSVGPFFKVDQGTGSVTFSASLALSQLDGLGFKRGAVISEFSVDDTMADAAVDSVPTESAVRGYIDKRLGVTHNGGDVLPGLLIPTGGGFMALSGQLSMKGNMNLGNNKIINLADPTNSGDAVNLGSLSLANLLDASFGDTKSADVMLFTGVGTEITNAEVVGDISFGLDSTAFTVDAQINPEVITNAEIDTSAGIVQSKLDLNLASSRAAAPTGTDAQKQANSGLASFDSAVFTVTDGFVTIKDNGITLTDLPQIAADSVLGNSTAIAGNITAVTFATVVNEGLALKKSNFTSTGFIRRKNVSSFTGDTGTGLSDSYEIVEQSSTNVVDTLVKRDINGDFAGRVITAAQFKLDNLLFADTSATGGGAGVTTLYGYDENAAIQLGDGPLQGDKRNYYDNEGHIFRPQNGIGNAPITCSTVTATGLTTGAPATAGTVEGQWTLTTGSRFEATYADLAEYYEGDDLYEVGTVLVFGGDKEVTVCSKYSDTAVAGVVSENSAYSMNAGCEGNKNLIALQGRVPVKVVGKIQKGDLLTTSEIHGVATKTFDAKVGTIIGKALENYDSDGVGVIEVAVGRA